MSCLPAAGARAQAAKCGLIVLEEPRRRKAGKRMGDLTRGTIYQPSKCLFDNEVRVVGGKMAAGP